MPSDVNTAGSNTHKVAFSFDVDAMSLWIGTHKATNASMVSRGEFAVPAMRRILEMLDRYDLRASCFIPGHTVLAYPDLVKEIAAQGHEIGHHGYVHERVTELTPEQEEAVLLRGIEILEDAVGQRPFGYRSPSWEFSEVTPQLLVKHGFRYDSSLMGSDFEPYWIRDGDRFTSDGPYEFGNPIPVAELPISWLLDDFPHFEFIRGGVNPGLKPPSQVYEMWVDELDYFCNRLPGGCFIVTMHPQIMGRGHRLMMLERFIEHVRDERDVEFVTLGQAADEWIAANPAPSD